MDGGRPHHSADYKNGFPQYVYMITEEHAHVSKPAVSIVQRLRQTGVLVNQLDLDRPLPQP